MTNEDYQLEELENAAVKKSNTAKRVAAAAGLIAAGSAAGGAGVYAATAHSDVPEREPVAPVSEEAIEDVAEGGANQVHDPEPEHEKPINNVPQHPKPENTTIHKDADISFDKTTEYYDENYDLAMTTEEGTVDGYDFKLVDVDGDGQADLMGVDVNGDGIYDESEMTALSGSDQIQMGHITAERDIVFVDEPNIEHDIEEPELYTIDEQGDPHAVAQNPEKNGEEYSYGGYGNVEEEVDYAYEEKDEYDYDQDVAQNENDDTFEGLDTVDSYDMV